MKITRFRLYLLVVACTGMRAGLFIPLPHGGAAGDGFGLALLVAFVGGLVLLRPPAGAAELMCLGLGTLAAFAVGWLLQWATLGIFLVTGPFTVLVLGTVFIVVPLFAVPVFAVLVAAWTVHRLPRFAAWLLE